MDFYPLQFRWLGDSFEPISKIWQKRADERYVVGRVYAVDAQEFGSGPSRRHQFAWLDDAWANLPEPYDEIFSDREKLRKHALIRCGYADQTEFVCANKAEAVRMAAWLKPMDEYAIITVNECVVTRYTAKSQSRKAMGDPEFNASKRKVLDWVAGLIRVTPEELERNVGVAA